MERDYRELQVLSKRVAKEIRALHARKGRVAAGQLLVESPKAVRSFLEAGWLPAVLAGTEAGWEAVVGTGALPTAACYVADERAMAEASALDTPSSFLAVFPHPEVPEIPAVPSGIHVVLDGVRDPGNVGTILRLADWFGATAVWLSEDAADPYQPKVVQASMGSLARIPVGRLPLTDLLVAWRADGALSVWATDMAGTPLAELPRSNSTVLVFGNEGQGISAPVRSLCTGTVTIPRIAPGAESLNVAAAAAIALYEIRR
jgi:TrmH family RNA methyltransferase